ncbi:MAG: NUDIX domain-containing protein [Candidatus Diapherotrites archaeon]
MTTKFGATGIVFKEENGKRLFLLLHRCLNWSGWEFPKGGIDEGENAEQAVLREISEETALKKISIAKKLPEKVKWSAKGKDYVYAAFLVKAEGNEEVKVGQKFREHDSFQWVEAEKAMQMLEYENQKELFGKALKELG